MIGSTQDPLATRALGAAIGLAMLPVCVFALASLYLLVGGRLEIASTWLILVLGAVGALMLARRTGGVVASRERPGDAWVRAAARACASGVSAGSRPLAGSSTSEVRRFAR